MCRKPLFVLFAFLLLNSCPEGRKPGKTTRQKKIVPKEEVVVDCNYTFEEAIAGTPAPKCITDQLVLVKVRYYSIDNKIHEGQILTNRQNEKELKEIFEFILRQHFPVSKAIPVVKYHWNDDLSMQDNNSYSFCYRNTSFSKHATGMAIDINPFFNPVRWKNGCHHRPDKPAGAAYNPEVAGTFYSSHPVVLEFEKRGFRWGHFFRSKYDDHHFEK
ncbi:MAG TPA: M15 family metallopeptidase [Paludibacter sp.]|nr:M15 family metallopeptidase [Paludibacter sp.]